MRNPLARLNRRDTTKPTLRERAASLKATAVRVMGQKPIEGGVETSPAPALTTMVDEWLRLRSVLSSDLEDEVANPLHQRWIELQLAIYRFPATTLADLQAKAPVLRDELGIAEEFQNDASRDLPTTAWRGVLADIERLSSQVGSTTGQSPLPLDAAEVLPNARANAECVDVAPLSLVDLRALSEVAAMIGDVAAAATCQPRCRPDDGPFKPSGVFADWVADLCNWVENRCRAEASNRRPVGEDDAQARICILAISAIENGDPGELAAFVRDLRRAM